MARRLLAEDVRAADGDGVDQEHRSVPPRSPRDEETGGESEAQFDEAYSARQRTDLPARGGAGPRPYHVAELVVLRRLLGAWGK
jgi:hypothetical protein